MARGRPPVIVIGMHRSGTTLLSRMLSEMGVCMGRRIDRYGEATFFLKSNEWLLTQAGATWDAPANFELLLRHDTARSLARDYLELALRYGGARHYLGLLRGFGRNLRDGPPFNWGWKDPRNTWTLPLWLDLFPEAKIIEVVRHGVDVANSLVLRQEQGLVKHRTVMDLYGRTGLRARALIRARRGRGVLRGHTLESALRLWADYVEQGTRYSRTRTAEFYRISFEELSTGPVQAAESLANFLGLALEPDQMPRVAAMVRPDRSLAFSSDPTLVEFARRHAKTLERFGYADAAHASPGFDRRAGGR